MSEAPTPTKKQKMSDEASSSTGSSQPLKIFNPYTQKFADVRVKKTFIDHTELIKIFFEDEEPKKLFVTAPSHFCKSTNLSMLRLFYENKSGGTVESMLEDRQSYPVFKDTKIMNIDSEEHRQNLIRHCCAHPVLHVNFAIVKLKTYKTALMHILNVTLKAYQYHKSFLEENLKDSEKETFQTKMRLMKELEGMATIDVERIEIVVNDGLEKLCNYLYNASGGKRVLILIDEADALVTAAITNGLSMEETKDIGWVMADLFGNITKEEDIHDQVQGVLLTGISYLKGTGFSNKVKTESHRFLNDDTKDASQAETTVDMYGITENQLKELLVKLEGEGLLWEDRNNIMETIDNNYNGYYTSPGGKSIYSLWSVLHFLRSQKTVVHADMSPLAEYYRKAFKSTKVAENITELLAKEDVNITYVKEINIEELVYLRDIECGTVEERDLLFSLLMEVGFLTNSEQQTAKDGVTLSVKIPNEEVKSVFQSMIKKYKIQLGRFNLAHQQECAKEIDKLSVTKDEAAFKQHLKSIYEKLVMLCNQFNPELFNEKSVAVLITTIMLYSDFSDTVPEFYSSEDHGYVDVRSTNKKLNCTCIWELKVNKEQAENKTSMWAMMEILGDKKTRKKGYMKAANVTENFILLGLSVNEELKPSICFRMKGREKGIFVSETEHKIKNFASRYQGWYDVLKETIVGASDDDDNSNRRFQETAHSSQLNSVS